MDKKQRKTLEIKRLRRDNKRLHKLLSEAHQMIGRAVRLANGLTLDTASPRTNFLLGWVWAGGSIAEGVKLFSEEVT